MQKIKVIYDVKLGGGFGVLCLAGAVALVTNSFVKFAKWAEEEEKRKELKECIKAVHSMDELMKKLDEIDIDLENAKKQKEAVEES